MKRVLALLTAVALLIAIGRAQADVATVKTTAAITSATIYVDGGLILRGADAPISAGATAIAIDGLPLGIVADNTLISGKGQFTIVSTEFRTIYERKAPSPEVAEMVKQLAGIDQKLQGYDNEREMLKKQEAFYSSLFPADPEKLTDPKQAVDMTADAVKNLLDTVTAGLEKIALRMHEIDKAVKDLKAQKAALQLRISQLGGADVRYTRAIVSVVANAPCTAKIELLSLIGECNWSPNYDVRLATGGKVEVGYYADVRQWTGQEWKDINLTLSTSLARNVNLPPELVRWALTLTPPDTTGEPVMDAAAKSLGAPGLLRDGDRRSAGEAEAGNVAVGGGMAVEFPLEAASTLVGDGSIRRLAIKKLNFNGEIVYDAIPRMTAYAYARAEIINDSAYPLLYGPMKVYAGNEYLGTAMMTETSPGAKTKLYFGTDTSIEIKYRPMKRKADVNKRSQSYEYDWVIDITNHRSVPVTMSVLDALPKPGNEEIKVKSVDISPKPTETTDEQYIKWNFTLAPGEKKTLTVNFEVTAPGGKELSWEGAWEGGEQ
ncbi:MAG: mucoidy inhibitor MuiA family protein [Candidatus Brocadiia bacterium]